MSGCFGSGAYDLHLEKQVDRYCQEGDVEMATGKWRWVPDQPTEAMWQAGKEADIDPGDSYTKIYCAMIEAAPPAEPVTGERGMEAASTAARFNRLIGICRRLLWTDFGVPATDNEQTKKALEDLAEFLFADGIDAALSASPKVGDSRDALIERLTAERDAAIAERDAILGSRNLQIAVADGRTEAAEAERDAARLALAAKEQQP